MTPTRSRYGYEHRKQRAELIKRLGRECFVCGPIPKGLRVHMHHREGVQVNQEDVILLCASCHDILETISRRTRRPYLVRHIRQLYLLAVVKQLSRKNAARGANEVLSK